MLTLPMPIRRAALLGSGLALLGTAPASAGQLFRWTTSDGAVAYTDEWKRVPEAYRGQAERAWGSSLADYGRFTPADPGAEARYAERLAARLERLRALNAEPEIAPVAQSSLNPVAGLDLRSERRISERRLAGFDRSGRPVYRSTTRTRSVDEPTPAIAFAVNPADPAPVIVERRRVLDEDTGTTRHVTVVEQSGRVLGVIKPRVHMGPVHHGLEEDLER